MHQSFHKNSLTCSAKVGSSVGYSEAPDDDMLCVWLIAALCDCISKRSKARHNPQRHQYTVVASVIKADLQ